MTLGGLSAPRFPYLKKKGEKSKRPLELELDEQEEPISMSIPTTPVETDTEGEGEDSGLGLSWRKSRKTDPSKKPKSEAYTSYAAKGAPPATTITKAEITELCKKMAVAFG